MKININTLSDRIAKSINARSLPILKKRANKLIDSIHTEAKNWKMEIRSKLMKPAISRGYSKGKLKPHDSLSINEGFPMMVKGHLAKSLHYRVSQKAYSNHITVSIRRWTTPVLNSSGKDYGEILNGTGGYKGHPVLEGWKDRMYNALDERLRKL